ncbi:MAG: DUF29 domain-containing protein, partial [Oscillatoriales cyanobacterium]
MTTKLEVDRHKLYDTDYLRWIETTVEKLRSRDYSNIDWENLIEEIEDMGRSERRSLESNLVVIILHLLKWQFQPDRRSGSWKASIAEHRRRIRKAVKDSLKSATLSREPPLSKTVRENFSSHGSSVTWCLSR